MYYLFSYENPTATDNTSTYGTSLFVGDALTRSAYSSITKFYREPYTDLDKLFISSFTFNSHRYSKVCQLPDLSISTIRTAILNHFPEYFI
jgi:hypothetical protein